ncbi:hypothetical protein XENOCAPTIV_007587 [Xenoophorus captivus]|uniref:Uncharacterized protein n=1 Tax=Xenoophorus captivus TaxID=1517983 RepID=A0ABV0SEP5_9TELE
MIQKTPANPPLNDSNNKREVKEWSNQSLDLNLIEMVWSDNQQSVLLENPPMCLNYINSARHGGSEFLHSDIKDSVPVSVKPGTEDGCCCQGWNNWGYPNYYV